MVNWHMMRGVRFCLTAVALVVLSAALSAAEAESGLPTPVTTPAATPFVPEGERSFYPGYMHTTPGARIWVQNLHGDLWHYGTTQSVGDGTGMYVWLGPKGKPGFMCSMDTGVVRQEKDGKVTRDDFKEFRGISLWFKGDGSDGTAIFTTDYAGSKRRFRVPLKETRWHKVFMPWEKWQEPVTGPFWFLTFGLERRDDSKANWYIIDRVHLYREEKTEEVTPTPDTDPPGLLDARAFVSGREHITKTLTKLREKRPVRIVVAGDSIAVGAQLWYTARDYTDKETAWTYIFWQVLARRLKEHCGYGSVAAVVRSWDAKAKAWKDREDPRPPGELTVLGVATGGWKAGSGLEHIDEILGEKPDLVVWEYGANDVVYGNLDGYVKATGEAIDRMKAAGIEVVLQTLTPGASITPVHWLGGKSVMARGGEFSKETRRLAREKSCALADMERAFLARGAQFVGDLYADNVHPNHYGHEMLADVLDALLTDRDVRIWKYGPAAEKARRR